MKFVQFKPRPNEINLSYLFVDMSKYFLQEYNEKTLQRCSFIELLI